MLKLNVAIAASAAAIVLATAPAFAGETLTLRSMMVADIGHDVDAFSARTSEAKIIDAAAADRALIDVVSNASGSAVIKIDLGANGKLLAASVLQTSGRQSLDRSALAAVRASKYQAATVAGSPVSGTYAVNVVFDSDL